MPIQRNRLQPMTPRILQDVLQAYENAADIITRQGHIVRNSLGARWGNEHNKVYRTIMDLQDRIKRAHLEDQDAIAAGKGERGPNGAHRPNAIMRAREEREKDYI